jgi:hypothetical protein
MDRVRFLAGFAIAFAASAIAGPPILPPVKEWKDSGRQVVLAAPVRIAIGSENPADRFAAQALVGEIELDGATATSNVATAAGPHILIGRPGQSGVDRELTAAGLSNAVPERPESYLVHIGETGVLVVARDAPGLYYGTQTLRQLMRPARGGIAFSAGDIRDWPELSFRGLSVDLGQGAVPTEAQMRNIIRTAAEYKLNVVSFYMQHLVAFRASPLLVPKDAELDAAAIGRLVDFAARHHVALLPQQQTFGHLHHLLKHEIYTDLGEVPHGTTLTAGDPAVYRWIEGAVEELTALFPGSLFHAGGDETWDLGKGVNREAVASGGETKLWVDHMTRVAEMLRKRGRRTLFWGDIALKTPALIAQLPKDMIAATWTYEPDERFADYIAPFRKAGLDVVVCPSVNNWSKPVPDFAKAVTNIGRFVAEGGRQGALGMLNTAWFDDGESLFDTSWYPVIYSAAAAWDGTDYPRERFDESFDWAFHRAPGTAISGAVRKLGEVHRAMRDAGFVDAANEYLWLDPYSERGAKLYARVQPQARRIRLLSEEALTAIVAARPQCRLHPEALEFLNFGARRLDWFGMKVQFAAQIQSLYRDAWENQGDTHRANYDLLNISDVNGLVQDLRDEAGEMKNQYRELWLSVNRPYLLNGMLGLYDRELLYWLDKATRVAEIRANYRNTRALPDPAAAGVAMR